MGFLTKSTLILLIAVSTPLIYRQFANDNTVKYMSSYYSNYKVIDQFLRQSANHLDRAKEYLPESEQIQVAVGKLNQQILSLIDNVKSKAGQESGGNRKDSAKNRGDTTERRDQTSERNVRMSSCPGEAEHVRVWGKSELLQYDGSKGDTIYLAFLGTVYDVSVNSQHYGNGAEYNIFTGLDATRAFITGNFTDDLNDNLDGIDESLYPQIEGWMSFYSTSYPSLGRLEGKFYDSRGCGTAELARVKQVFAKLSQEREASRELEKEHPECNSEWNSELSKGKVWCTKQSGGIERDWDGVPRILNNVPSPRCVCQNLEDPNLEELNKIMTPYPNCDLKATECALEP